MSRVRFSPSQAAVLQNAFYSMESLERGNTNESLKTNAMISENYDQFKFSPAITMLIFLLYPISNLFVLICFQEFFFHFYFVLTTPFVFFYYFFCFLCNRNSIVFTLIVCNVLVHYSVLHLRQSNAYSVHYLSCFVLMFVVIYQSFLGRMFILFFSFISLLCQSLTFIGATVQLFNCNIVYNISFCLIIFVLHWNYQHKIIEIRVYNHEK